MTKPKPQFPLGVSPSVKITIKGPSNDPTEPSRVKVDAVPVVCQNKMVDRSANDDTPDALAAAAHNYELVKNDWCTCKEPPRFRNTAYYRHPKTGDHGWMCAACHGIVQTG
jgi:hypothetical protein